MKRIVVLGDSLALPRKVERDYIKWEETWPYLLQQKLNSGDEQFEVINCSKRARRATSLTGHDFLEHIIFKEPDILILQVGIVDGAPRIISLRERAILNHRFFPASLKNKIIAFRKKRKRLITSKAPLAKVYTQPNIFKSYLQQFFKKIKKEYPSLNGKIIVLPIVANLHLMEQESPKYGKNMKAYNQILAAVSKKFQASFLEISRNFCEKDANFCSDGYHLSYTGNKHISSCLSEVIKND